MPSAAPLGNGNDAPDVGGVFVISQWGTQTVIENLDNQTIRYRPYNESDRQKWVVGMNKHNLLTLCNVQTKEYLNSPKPPGEEDRNLWSFQSSSNGDDMYPFNFTPLSTGGYRISIRAGTDPDHFFAPGWKGEDNMENVEVTLSPSRAISMGLDRVG